MARIIAFASKAAIDHRVVTRSLSCLPMAIDTYLRRACTKIIIDQIIAGYSLALRLAVSPQQ